MSTFLAQLATLRDFLSGMGFHVEDNNTCNTYHRIASTSIISGNSLKPAVSERELHEILKSGYNVESALEYFISRLSSGSDDGGDIGGGRSGADSDSRNAGGNDLFGTDSASYAGMAPAAASTTTTMKATTSASGATTMSPFETHNTNNSSKRFKINHGRGDSSASIGARNDSGDGGGAGNKSMKTSHNHIIIDRRNHTATSTNYNPNRRLLLCKRWTVATSTNPQRGGCNVRYGEMLDFGENYVTTTASSCKNLNRRIGGGPTVGKDPMVVRFRSYSSSSPSLSRGGSIIQGTLSRYLSSILSPLLRYLPTDESEEVGDLISIEGKTMMEDYGLVIGSEIPIVLKVYINDPARFFGLFHCQQQHQHQDNDEVRGGPAYLAHLKGGGGWKKKNKGNNRSTYNIYVAEAAFRLLQWAEKGGEEEEAFVLAQESVVVAETKEEQGTLAGRKNYLDTGVNRSSLSSFNDDDGDDDCFNRSERERGRDRDENVIALEVDGEVVVDEEEVDDKFSQLLLSSASDDRNNLQSKAMPELSDPKGFRQDIALRPYQRQALHFMCRREGVVIEDEMENIDYDDIDEELNSILAEQLQPSSSTSSKDNASNQIWDGAVASCTCGPVVVRDETVASGAIPVIEYNGSVTAAVYQCDGKRGKYVHHPLWQRRYLVAADDFNSVFAFYVNELMGTASSRLPKPPNKCCGGILADAMGLGKTVMLLALILKTKENEVSGISPENPCEMSTVTPRTRRVSHWQIVPPKDESEEMEYKNNHDADGNDDDDDDDDDDDELWADEQGSKVVHKRPSIKEENSTNGTTLVIAPLSLISQWEEEISTKTNLSHLLCYDLSPKRRICGDDFACVDVVVTTYGTVQSLFDVFSRNGPAKSSQKHSLFNFNWRRIILDEAHVVKNPSTLISKACCTLNAESRWCVTGTPIQNSLQDVYGLLKFLRHEPWCGAAFWRSAVTNFISDVASGDRKSSDNPVDVNDDTKDYSSIAAFGRVRRLLAPILLRRTKATLTEDGTPIISLPPIDYSVVRVTLSPPEREFYNALLERSQSIFEGFIVAGTASKSWFAIFSLLQRLRQACDHVSLTVSKNTSEIASKYSEHAQDESSSNVVGGDGDFLSGLLIKFRTASNGMIASASGESTFVKQVAETLSKSVQSSEEFLKSECPICLEEPRVEDAVYTPCAHMFCRDCLLSVFREQVIRSKDTKVTNAPAVVEGGNCPVCHACVKMSSIVQITKSVNGQAASKFLDQPLTQTEKENSPNASTETNQRIFTARVTLESALNGASSSKLEAILDELDKVRNDGKVLIFSQYLGFLDIVGKALDKLGVETFRIDGKLSLKERVSAMSNFNKSQQGSVFLISMKAGGVGLNLVAASTVFIVDPWWNQALEDQCINRIHRIGQRAKIVRVRKFVVTDSVEEKIVDLQGKKKGMANEILRGADDGDQLESAAKPSLEDFKLLLGR